MVPKAHFDSPPHGQNTWSLGDEGLPGGAGEGGAWGGLTMDWGVQMYLANQEYCSSKPRFALLRVTPAGPTVEVARHVEEVITSLQIPSRL